MPYSKCALVLGAVAVGSAPVVAQADFPERRVEIVVPWTAGGSSTAHVQLMTQKLEELLGANVVVRNIAGAAGTIGTAEVANAEPDGYTLLATPAGPTTIQPHLRDIPYTLDDFDVVCAYTQNPFTFMVAEASEYQTMDEFVAAAKEAPGELGYATAGVGTLPHIIGLAVGRGFGVDLLHLPTSGGADAMRAVLGGQIAAAPETVSHLERYDVRGLAVTTAERMDEYPEIPTLRELGVDALFSHWHALYVPAGTPAEVQQVLADACTGVFEDEEVVAGMEAMNSFINVRTGEPVQAFADEQSAFNRTLLVEAGLLPE
ncbi:Bug family tripartite tricarboxylate transporter substrate binding protein [Acuticoccus sp.]|uniref:Bug family tripartite tricarboxylate transporter substrate binding protein n=1 Tax=Acuticoccus sp. TaxID=1904378 RepID=UPI003B5225C4